MENNPLSKRRITMVLLACGASGAPLFLVLSHVDAVTRPGHELMRHGASPLMLGGLGWIQIVNFVVTGVLMLACAVGCGRHSGRDGVPGTADDDARAAGVILW